MSNQLGGFNPNPKQEFTTIFTWISFVAGILALILFFTASRFYSLPLSVLAIGSGLAAIRIIRRDKLQGMALAVAGLVCGIMILVFFIITMVLVYQAVKGGPRY